MSTQPTQEPTFYQPQPNLSRARTEMARQAGLSKNVIRVNRLDCATMSEHAWQLMLATALKSKVSGK